MLTCLNCGAKLGAFSLSDYCQACREAEKQAKQSGDGSDAIALQRHSETLRSSYQAASEGPLMKDPATIVITTTDAPVGAIVAQQIDIIGAEIAIGMNILRDFAADWRDIIGGRSDAVQKALREARAHVLADLRIDAARRGADAVVGVRIDYSDMGSRGQMLFVAATGTAVKLAPVEPGI
jgi:uncharacterized protein YbjQ (UPF0145 family)